MFLPTTYLTVVLAIFSWSSFFPSGFQLPTITWPSSTEPQIISPQPPHVSLPTSSPTAVPTAKPTPSPIPTATPRPTPKPTTIPTPIPTTTPSTNLLDSKQQYILDQINQYRAANGLSVVNTNQPTCDFAKTRSQELTTSFTHDGFTTRANSHTLPYSTYHNITENIAMTNDYTQVVTMWKNSTGHAANMRSDTPFVCVAYTGNYYAYEGWKP